jgi:hypothetical protein
MKYLEAAHLGRDGIRDFSSAVADVAIPKAAQRIDVDIPPGVGYLGTITADDVDERATRGARPCVGMKETGKFRIDRHPSILALTAIRATAEAPDVRKGGCASGFPKRRGCEYGGLGDFGSELRLPVNSEDPSGVEWSVSYPRFEFCEVTPELKSDLLNFHVPKEGKRALCRQDLSGLGSTFDILGYVRFGI